MGLSSVGAEEEHGYTGIEGVGERAVQKIHHVVSDTEKEEGRRELVIPEETEGTRNCRSLLIGQ